MRPPTARAGARNGSGQRRVLGEERGGGLARADDRMRDEPAQEREVRGHAADLGLVERRREPVERLRARRRRARRASRSSGRTRCRSRRPRRRRRRRGSPVGSRSRSTVPACGRNVRGSSAYSRTSTACPCKAQSATCSDRGSPRAIAQLRTDEVDAGDELGHRVLDLDARVQLEEVELARRRARTRRCRRSRMPIARANVTAASLIRARSSGSTAGDGDSSSTFWWRRCTEQSRSPSATTAPCRSASSWISTWRGRSR